MKTRKKLSAKKYARLIVKEMAKMPNNGTISSYLPEVVEDGVYMKGRDRVVSFVDFCNQFYYSAFPERQSQDWNKDINIEFV